MFWVEIASSIIEMEVLLGGLGATPEIGVLIRVFRLRGNLKFSTSVCVVDYHVQVANNPCALNEHI